MKANSAGFRRTERAGRFVENENAGSAVQATSDFDHLSRDQRKATEAAGDIDAHVEFFKIVCRSATHMAPIDQSPTPGGLASQEQVLGHRKLTDAGQLLIDHRNAMSQSNLGAGQMDQLAGKRDLS